MSWILPDCPSCRRMIKGTTMSSFNVVPVGEQGLCLRCQQRESLAIEKSLVQVKKESKLITKYAVSLALAFALMVGLTGCNNDDDDEGWTVVQPVTATGTTEYTPSPAPMPSPASNGPRYRGVFFGANTYPGAPLRGCVNDARDMRKRFLTKLRKNIGVKDGIQFIGDTYVEYDDNTIVKNRVGVSLEDLLNDDQFKAPDNETVWRSIDKQIEVRFAMNEFVTKRRMLRDLNWYVADCSPGVIRCGWQSGHGTPVPDRNGDEEDGNDQAFCTIRFSWNDLDGTAIVDDEYYEIFKVVPPGSDVSFGSDSCYSGTLIRGMVGGKAYPIAPPPEIAAKIARGAVTHKRSKLLSPDLNITYISGCDRNETSKDITDENGRPCGAMTHYLLKSMDALPDSATWRELVIETNKYTKPFDQTPQCEGLLRNNPVWQGIAIPRRLRKKPVIERVGSQAVPCANDYAYSSVVKEYLTTGRL